MPVKAPKPWLAQAITIAVAAATGLGAGLGGPKLAPEWFRPDPYTSSDASSQHLLMEYRLTQHEVRLNALDETIKNLPPPELIDRVTELEKEVHSLMIRMEIPHRHPGDYDN